MVRDVVLTGNVFPNPSKNIEMIGKDFELQGQCGRVRERVDSGALPVITMVRPACAHPERDRRRVSNGYFRDCEEKGRGG
jgi:hypothetical protein